MWHVADKAETTFQMQNCTLGSASGRTGQEPGGCSGAATGRGRGAGKVEFDGFRLEVIDGVVQFFNLLGENRYVTATNGSSTRGDDPPSDPDADRAENALVSTDTDQSGGGGGAQAASATGRLTVVIDVE